MTQEQFIVLLFGILAFTYLCMFTVFSVKEIKQAKAKVKYYQNPGTQIAIAQHVIKNRWYRDNDEVFK